jgi:hypothetical protein
MNKMGFMHGSKETAKGRAAEKKHKRDLKSGKARGDNPGHMARKKKLSSMTKSGMPAFSVSGTKTGMSGMSKTARKSMHAGFGGGIRDSVSVTGGKTVAKVGSRRTTSAKAGAGMSSKRRMFTKHMRDAARY